jgi:hypothetical protein
MKALCKLNKTTTIYILTPDPSCPANVVVLPLPQLPVSMATSYQHIQTSVHEEIVLDDLVNFYQIFVPFPS